MLLNQTQDPSRDQSLPLGILPIPENTEQGRTKSILSFTSERQKFERLFLRLYVIFTFPTCHGALSPRPTICLWFPQPPHRLCSRVPMCVLCTLVSEGEIAGPLGHEDRLGKRHQIKCRTQKHFIYSFVHLSTVHLATHQ